MAQWPDRRLLDLLGIEHPLLLAPMAGPGTPELAIAVGRAGGLAALPCAQLGVPQVREAVATIRQAGAWPLNLNFFCHTPPPPDPVRALSWRARLAPYYLEFGLDPEAAPPAASRRPFVEDYCRLVEELRPQVVSFHFGLPAPALVQRVRAAGARILSSATTVAEARWLEAQGCDAVIAMGLEAGGHRGTFLGASVAQQAGTFALVPQVADAVRIPVIAAGGIADSRGIVAALALGASAVQIGTAYLFCPEAKLPLPHRQALRSASDEATRITRLFTGGAARGFVNRLMRDLDESCADVPAVPLAASALAPLKARAEAAGSGDFTNLWSGQSAALCREQPAGDLTRELVAQALARLSGTRPAS